MKSEEPTPSEAAFLFAAMSDQTQTTSAKFKPARWAEKLLRHRRHNYPAFAAVTSERVRRALADYERRKREAAQETTP